MAEARRNKKDLREMHQLIAELVSLVGSADTIRKLIPYGDDAIAALRTYLLKGTPGSVYQPRQQAVFALAELGARDVLFEYLRAKRKIEDPVIRGAEEWVESSAARELARWIDETTFQFLLKLASKKFLTGGLEALGEFERPEAIPIFLRALEDDFYRPAAEKALSRVLDMAQLFLIHAATVPTLQEGYEPPSSVRRRQAALKLLAETNLSPEHWLVLQPLLADEHHEIIVAIGVIASLIAPEEDRETAKRQIVFAYARSDWETAMELEAAFRRLNRKDKKGELE